jgi:hypothetical protein
MPRAVCNALWIGPSLDSVEAACLASFVAAGHPVDLYCYEHVSGIPPGVNVRDGNDILPGSAIERYRCNGSPSLFSNRFRYAVLAARKGVWIDCDVLCLRPIQDRPVICAWQEPAAVNGAVLKLPADHPVLSDLQAIFTTRYWTPPWESFRNRLRWAVQYRREPQFGIADMAFGMTGPRALTHYLRKHRLLDDVLPADAFNPVHWTEASLMTASHHSVVTARIRPSTVCVHLWHQKRVTDRLTIERGSFLEAVIEGTWPALVGPQQ